MMSASMNIWQPMIEPPEFNTDEFSEKERLQICIKGMKTVPQLNIQMVEDAKIGLSKYWTVTASMEKINNSEEQKEVQSFTFITTKILDMVIINIIIILSHTIQLLDSGSI